MIFSCFKSIVTISILFFSVTIFSQKTWLDKNWNKTTQGNASFYREAPQKIGDLYEIIQHYKSGDVSMKGFSKSRFPEGDNFEGLIKVYYETGEIKEERFYLNGKREDVWKTYHKSGKINTKGKYRDGEKVGVWKTFYKNVYDDFLQP